MKITLISLIILFSLILLTDVWAWCGSHSMKFASFLGYEMFLVSSNDMEPTINRGDIVFCKNVREQDIVSFYRDDSIIIHQVKRIEEENGQTIYRTGYEKGFGVDIEHLTNKDVIGKYVFKIPWIGNLLLNWDVLLLVILLLLASGLLFFIHKKKNLKLEKE